MKSAKSLLFLPLAICTVVLSVANASAQNQSVELTPGKKVLYVDRLGLPEYLNVSELLQLFPECVARGDELYSNFDIQYDGKSVGSGRNIFDNVTTDISRTGANTAECAYDLYNRRIILGASYRIGGRK